eukprot:scaffold24358_cov60-Phaeocystis_antarctica.AAC.2
MVGGKGGGRGIYSQRATGYSRLGSLQISVCRGEGAAMCTRGARTVPRASRGAADGDECVLGLLRRGHLLHQHAVDDAAGPCRCPAADDATRRVPWCWENHHVLQVRMGTL